MPKQRGAHHGTPQDSYLLLSFFTRTSPNPLLVFLLIILLIILVLIHQPTPLPSYAPTSLHSLPPITQQTKRGAPNERPAAKQLVIIPLNP